LSTVLTCTICHTSGRAHETGLRTCEDVRHLGNYAVYRCDACGNAFTHPDLAPGAYELLPDATNDALSPVESKLLQWMMKRRIDKLQTFAGEQTARLLDIGGGACAFANAAAQRGYDVTVIEPNEKNRAYADTKRNVRFVADQFPGNLLRSNILAPASFDIVTMWHSLEHTPQPVEVLAAIRSVLKPGGLLFVSVPNIDSLQARTGGNYWTYLDVPHHLCHFSPRGLESLLRKCGFELRHSFRFSAEYDLFGWYQTLLNVVSRSHNYFYNSRKKRRLDQSYLRFPTWTKVVTAVGPILLPFAAAAALIAFAVNSPSCVEMIAMKELE
jgi:2-polyprenyl-3-methyl-5-hydroxy-6-metoxy-1,4-benzoquinol methylase